MPTIPVTDKLGVITDLQLEPGSDLGKSQLQSLESQVSEFGSAAARPLNETPFRSATFGATLRAPTIAISDELTLAIKSGATATITVYRESDGRLFADDGSPAIKITGSQAWVSFSLKTAFDLAACATAPSGFALHLDMSRDLTLASYLLLQAADGKFPSLAESVEKALASFHFIHGAEDLLATKAGTVHSWNASGSFTISGSYQLPLAVNSLCLADVKLPFHFRTDVIPAVSLALKGTLKIIGELQGRFYRGDGNTIQLGLFKKKETDMAASFTAGAGVEATLGSTDLLAAAFSVLPDADFKAAGIPEADRKVMQAALQGAVDQGFSIALNASCSASYSDEVAVLYEIDWDGAPNPDLSAALEAALKGDWTSIGALPMAKELRNILTRTSETRFAMSFNLLGIYNYASVSDFIRSCTIMHNLEDGSVTVTDKETASHICVGAQKFLAEPDRLRKVLDDSFLATTAYTAAANHEKLNVALKDVQNLLIYTQHSNAKAARKNLQLGVALQLLAPGDLAQVSAQDNLKYFRIAASTKFEGAHALRLFFADPQARIPRQENALKQVGRQVLASLLDRSQPVDNARWLILNDDAAWAQMDAQHFPPNSPGSHSDWYDVTFWAQAVAGVGPALKAVLDCLDTETAADPTKDPAFMAKREALAQAIANVTRNTKAAYEKTWPLAVMFALSGCQTPATFTAGWDGKTVFEKRSLTAAAQA